MDALEVIKQAAEHRDVPLSVIGPAMGKSRQYAYSIISQGGSPRANTLASMLSVCDYNLCALPIEATPPDVMVIDPSVTTVTDMPERLKALRDERTKLQAEQERISKKLKDIDAQLEMFD